MSQKFTVQLLTDKEFDNLPYRNISDSLGLADVKKGLVFVRRTGMKDFDEATLHHEIDHMVEEHATDEDEDGIRHKKGGVLRNIIPMILGAIAAPFTAGTSLAWMPALLGAASSVGMNQYAQSRHPEQLGRPGQFGSILGQGITGALSGMGGATAATGGIAGGTQAGAGFLSKAAGIGKGILVGTGVGKGGEAATSGLIGTRGALLGMGTVPATAATTPGMSMAGGGVGNIAGQPLTPVPGGFSLAGGTAPAIAGGAAPAMSLASGPGQVGNAAGVNVTPFQSGSIPAGTTQLLGQSASTAVKTPATEAPKSFISRIGDFAKKPENILGAGSLLASTGIGGTPQLQTPDSVEELRMKLQQGQALSPLGQQAQAELSRILAGDTSYLIPQYRNLETQFMADKEALDNRYNIAGVYGSGEHLAAIDELQKNYSDAKTDLASKQKIAAIQTALNVDLNTASQLFDISNLDVNIAAQKYNTSVSEIQGIRDALSRLGISLLSGGNMGGSGGTTINIGG